MASKQLGKLRQWAGEVVSTKDKTVVTEEFKELERDVDLRRAGIERLNIACDVYFHALTKKKHAETLEKDQKVLPIETLGLTMAQHGDEFGEESAFGQCLVRFGRAHCKIAAVQESYAETLKSTYLASIEASLVNMADYQAQRKKLDSRRLTLDAATTKLQKAKKEKEKAEAEVEVGVAKIRYEEISEEVQSRMHAIQENELQQLRDLTEFLDVELEYARKYLEVLVDLKKDWLDESSVQRVDIPRSRSKPSHSFSNSVDASPASKPKLKRAESSKSSSGALSKIRKDKEDAKRASENFDDSDNDSGDGNSTEYVDAYSDVSRPRSRANSVATNVTTGSTGTSSGKRMSGWLGLGGVLGRKGSSKKNFTSLDADEDEDDEVERVKEEKEKEHKVPRSPTKKPKAASAFGYGVGRKEKDKSDGEEEDSTSSRQATRSRSSFSASVNSSLSLSSTSQAQHPPIPQRLTKPNQNQKTVQALYDFAATNPDELSMKVGDEIIVTGEVSDGWWTGECRGKTGMFPANYTKEVMKPVLPPPPLARLHSNSSSQGSIDHKDRFIGREPVTPTSDDGITPIITSRRSNSISNTLPGVPTYTPTHAQFPSNSTQNDDEPFGDHHHAATSDDDDDELQGRQGLLSNSIVSSRKLGDSRSPMMPNRSLTGSTILKKAPPPPPARRSTTSSKHPAGSGSIGSLKDNPAAAAFASAITKSRPTTPGAKTKSPFDHDGEWN